MTAKEIDQKLSDVLSFVMSGDIEIYHKYISPMRSGEIILDVGTGYGKSAMAMGMANPNVNIITIDDASMPVSNNYSTKDSYRATLENSFREHGVSNIMFVDGDVTRVELPVKKFDVIHIDMMAEYETVALMKWLPTLKKSGVLLLRNYMRNKDNFDIVLKENGFTKEVGSGGLIYVFKRG